MAKIQAFQACYPCSTHGSRIVENPNLSDLKIIRDAKNASNRFQTVEGIQKSENVFIVEANPERITLKYRKYGIISRPRYDDMTIADDSRNTLFSEVWRYVGTRSTGLDRESNKIIIEKTWEPSSLGSSIKFDVDSFTCSELDCLDRSAGGKCMKHKFEEKMP